MSSHSVNPSILSNLKLVKSLKTFSKRRQEILLAFLFGSSTRDRLRPSSDVDIGVLFKTVPEMDALNDLTGELSSILKREVDLVVLNHTSPILKMQILKNGIFTAPMQRFFSSRSSC